METQEIQVKEILSKIEDLKPSAMGRLNVHYIDESGLKKYVSFYEKEDAVYFINHHNSIIITGNNNPGNEFEKITASLAKVLTEKNKRYGNSALNPVNVFGAKSKVGQRADDKLARIQNSEALRKNDVCDLIGYLILICKENDWTDFSDQID